ncbi:hypothetical protein PVL29_014782 [Vitis rotundifolia]|uniref:Uncharacterized protein n=1 Tax=Vitis rotundifolia TaxID=103349 RepID=A0AA39DLK4_VITRO|nr:hypothetical protein PVL29_014782 [Vitis rotundifolia]
MAKGDDAIQRKKNKANRKKLYKDSSSSAVSAHVVAIIASKKRRKSEKCRICKGMCFSLPTPEDPFNERHEKQDSKRQKTKKLVPSRQDGGLSSNGNNTTLKNGTLDGNHVNVDHQELKRHVKNIKNEHKEVLPSIDNVEGKLEKDYPSKFLILCLKSIQSALQQDVIFNCKEDKPLFVNEWGVCAVCKPLKALGIHIVSLHLDPGMPPEYSALLPLFHPFMLNYICTSIMLHLYSVIAHGLMGLKMTMLKVSIFICFDIWISSEGYGYIMLKNSMDMVQCTVARSFNQVIVV